METAFDAIKRSILIAAYLMLIDRNSSISLRRSAETTATYAPSGCERISSSEFTERCGPLHICCGRL